MSTLAGWWDKLPQNFRDAVGRFVKVVGAATVAAVVAYVVKALTGAQPVNAAELWAVVSVAVVSAVEKFFNFAPKVSKKVRKKK